MKINFKWNGWEYRLQFAGNVLILGDDSGIGKTKFINDLIDYCNNDYTEDAARKKIIYISSNNEFDSYIGSIESADIVCIDNTEHISTDRLDKLAAYINEYTNKVWIEAGHDFWVMRSYEEVKHLSIDDDNKLITLKERR